MTDREQVVAALQEIANQHTPDGVVDGINQQTIRDALELIKSMEAVKSDG